MGQEPPAVEDVYKRQNYTRRFKDTDLFEQIFQRILEECYRFKLVDSTEIFVDATPVSYTHLDVYKRQPL